METPTPTPQATAAEDDADSVASAVTLADLAAAHHLDRFAVVLEGSALWPRAFSGSLLVCSTLREPIAGDIVLAAVPPDGPVRALTLAESGDLTATRAFVPFDAGRGYRLLATVVQVVPPKGARG